MEIGILKWFDNLKGFGVIVTTNESQKEVFLHISNWEDQNEIDQNKKIPLVFSTELQRRKISAIECRLFDYSSIKDWEILFDLDINEKIRIEFTDYYLYKQCFLNCDEEFLPLQKGRIIKKLNEIKEEDFIEKASLFFKIHQITQNATLKQLLFGCLESRINELNYDLQFKIWHDGTLTGFCLADDLLISNHQKIDSEHLEKIDNEETISQILLKKIKALKVDFSFEEFEDFYIPLNFITTENLKKKLLKDLNEIAETNYKEALIEKLAEYGKLSESTYYKAIELFTSLPDFINKEIRQNIENEFSSQILKTNNQELIFMAWNDGFIEEISIYIQENLQDIELGHLESIINSDKIDIKLN